MIYCLSITMGVNCQEVFLVGFNLSKQFNKMYFQFLDAEVLVIYSTGTTTKQVPT